MLFTFLQKPPGTRTPESKGSLLAHACPASGENPGGLPWSLRSSLAPSNRQAGLYVGWEMSQGRSKISMWFLYGRRNGLLKPQHPELKHFCWQPLPSTMKRSQRRGPATQLGHAPAQPCCRRPVLVFAFPDPEEPVVSYLSTPSPPSSLFHPFQRKKKGHSFFLLKIFFKQTNQKICSAFLFPSFLVA